MQIRTSVQEATCISEVMGHDLRPSREFEVHKSLVFTVVCKQDVGHIEPKPLNATILHPARNHSNTIAA